MALTTEEKELIWTSLLGEHLRLLELYEKRKHYLETMDTSLELVRMVLEDDMPNYEKLKLVQTYRKHFAEKIKSIKDDIVKIINKDDELLADYIS